MVNRGRFVHLRLQHTLVVVLLIASMGGCASQPTSPAEIRSPQPTVSPLGLTVPQPTAQLASPPQQATTTVALPLVVNTARPTEMPPRAIVEGILGKINTDQALKDLRLMTGEDPICDDTGCIKIANRKTGSTGLQKVKNYFASELQKLGFTIHRDDWSRSGYSDQNIIAEKKGAFVPNEKVLFIAHLDGIAQNQLQRFPAADDNASGAVSVLQLARVLSHYSLNRSVVLFFSTGEEQGSLGVESYLDHVSAQEINAIQAVVDVDTIGYDADGDRVMQIFYGDHLPSKTIAMTLSELISEYQINLSPNVIVGCG